jgi:hypothetical protein
MPASEFFGPSEGWDSGQNRVGFGVFRVDSLEGKPLVSPGRSLQAVSDTPFPAGETPATPPIRRKRRHGHKPGNRPCPCVSPLVPRLRSSRATAVARMSRNEAGKARAGKPPSLFLPPRCPASAGAGSGRSWLACSPGLALRAGTPAALRQSHPLPFGASRPQAGGEHCARPAIRQG